MLDLMRLVTFQPAGAAQPQAGVVMPLEGRIIGLGRDMLSVIAGRIARWFAQY